MYITYVLYTHSFSQHSELSNNIMTYIVIIEFINYVPSKSVYTSNELLLIFILLLGIKKDITAVIVAGHLGRTCRDSFDRILTV